MSAPRTTGWELRLTQLGIKLPDTPMPAGSYVLAAGSGNLLYVSGQTWMDGGYPVAVGMVPAEVSIDRARLAARHCALACLAGVRATLGSLDFITRVVRVGGYVRSSPNFGQQPEVVNGASDVLIEIFGEVGRHARTSIGVSELPAGASVEIDALFEVSLDTKDGDGG